MGSQEDSEPKASAPSVKQQGKDKLLKDAATQELELRSNKDASSMVSGDKHESGEALMKESLKALS
jgi:hypothetical protein